jgi:hypothetical protein
MLGPLKETKRKIVASGTIYVCADAQYEYTPNTYITKHRGIKNVVYCVSNDIRHIQNTKTNYKICKL